MLPRDKNFLLMRATAWKQSPGNSAEWEKPLSKGRILPGSIYVTFSERYNGSDREQTRGCQGGGVGEDALGGDETVSFCVQG